MATTSVERDSWEGPAEESYVLGEESYKTPSPSSPDSCVTSTLSCVTEEENIIRGNYQMGCCSDLPELTLALIKPEGMKYLRQIRKRIRDDGFNIVQSRMVQLSPEDASNFYYEHYGQAYFPLLVAEMCEGPIQVYVLRRKDAVRRWRWICGPNCQKAAKKIWPECIRAVFGSREKGYKNVCHASESEEKAREEIRFFFPNRHSALPPEASKQMASPLLSIMLQGVAVCSGKPLGDGVARSLRHFSLFHPSILLSFSVVLEGNYRVETEVEDFINEYVNPTLLKGLIQLCKNKPLDPILWLATWLLKNNPYKPRLPDDVALTPT